MSRLVLVVLMLVALVRCHDETHDQGRVALPEFTLPGIHANLAVVSADSLFLTGNLAAAAALYQTALDDTLAAVYALARLAEIDYFQKVLYGHTYTTAFDSLAFKKVSHHGNLFTWVIRFYRRDGFHVDSFVARWNQLCTVLVPEHYWAMKGHLILGEYYKNHNFNRDSTHRHFSRFLEKAAGYKERKFYDFYWCYERLADISIYYRDHLQGMLNVNHLLETTGWSFDTDTLHLANAHALRGYLMYRFDAFEEAMKSNHMALLLLNRFQPTAVHQEVLKSCLVTSTFWERPDLFMHFSHLLRENISEAGKDYVNSPWLHALYHFQRREYKTSIPYFKAALDTCMKQPQLNKPLLQAISASYSIALEEELAFEEAITVYRMSDIYRYEGVWQFSDLIQQYEDDAYYYVSFGRYAQIFLKWAQHELRIDKLAQAEALARKAEDLLGDQRHTDEEAILAHLAEYHRIFSTLAQIQLMKYRHQADTAALEEYFTYCEKQRASLLRRDLLAKTDTTLASLILLEYRLRSALKHLKHRGAGRGLENLMDSLAITQAQITHLRPAYAQLQQEHTTIKALQSILPDSSVVILLNNHGSEIVQFVIARDALHLSSSPWNDTDRLKFDSLIAIVRGATMTTPSLYSAHAHDIFTWLDLDKEILRSAKQWNVLADETFTGFSFEALCFSNTGAEKFAELDYLVHRHCVVYAISAGMLVHSIQGIDSIRIQNVAILGWSDKQTIKRSHKHSLLPELTGTISECGIIRDRWAHARIFQGSKCTRENFIDVYSDPSIDLLHLAIHARSNPKARDQIHLYFRDENQIDTFSGHELLTSTGFAAVIVLSACEAASGKYESGDTEFHFPRYFLMNGASVVVAPMWVQEDLSSSQIFRHFYHSDLLNVPRKIQLAKVRYLLSEVTHDRRKHPAYWSGLCVFL